MYYRDQVMNTVTAQQEQRYENVFFDAMSIEALGQAVEHQAPPKERTQLQKLLPERGNPRSFYPLCMQSKQLVSEYPLRNEDLGSRSTLRLSPTLIAGCASYGSTVKRRAPERSSPQQAPDQIRRLEQHFNSRHLPGGS